MFLAPAANCADVVGHVPDGLQVVKVETLADATGRRGARSVQAETRRAFPPAQTTRLTAELSSTATRGIYDGLRHTPERQRMSTTAHS